MALTTSLDRPRRAAAALAATAALALGGGLALGGDVAAGTSEIRSRGGEPVAVGIDPVTLRFVLAVASCTEMYPPGTDITACVDNLS